MSIQCTLHSDILTTYYHQQLIITTLEKDYLLKIDRGRKIYYNEYQMHFT